MTAILAIDAAWTTTEPSGVALVCAERRGWRSVAVAPSYEMFMSLAAGNTISWDQRSIKGSNPDISGVLAAAHQLADREVELVTGDIPVATVPIKGRRIADRAISKEFGARWCGAHTPTQTRPGQMATEFTQGFAAHGYRLLCNRSEDRSPPCFLEVYPHPALLSLLQRCRRVPYKVSKARRYWPNTSVPQRVRNLLGEFQHIYDALRSVFGPLGFALPKSKDVPTLAYLKRYEDALDALVCAWVGVQFMAGKTVPLGDEVAAIWCPEDVVVN